MRFVRGRCGAAHPAHTQVGACMSSVLARTGVSSKYRIYDHPIFAKKPTLCTYVYDDQAMSIYTLNIILQFKL